MTRYVCFYLRHTKPDRRLAPDQVIRGEDGERQSPTQARTRFAGLTRYLR